MAFKDIPFIGAIWDGFNNLIPKLEDEVTVEIIGQPGSKKAELYRLALATAYGIVKRFDAFQFLGPPPGMLMIEYDAADHWVRATLRYRTNTLTSNIFRSRTTPSVLTSAVAVGPPETIIGGQPKIPVGALPAPLPFTGRVILTSDERCGNPDPALPPTPTLFGIPINTVPSPNPKPSGDNRSRGSFHTDKLIPLVFSALSDPGSLGLMEFRSPVAGPSGG